MEADIRLRHLRTLREVARQGAVGRAAEVLRLSQPAVSRTLRELEASLGTPLVARDGRGIRLTAAGETFLRHAEAGLTAIRQGIESVGPKAAGEPPLLAVGALPTVSARLMPLAIARFRAATGRQPISVITGDNRLLLGQLRQGRLDLVVGRLAAPEQMAGLSFEYLYSEHVRFVVRAGHPLLQRARFVARDIRDFLVLIPVRDAIIRPYVERLLIANGVADLPERIETISDSFGRALLRRSDAIWIISEGVVANDLAEGTLAALPIDTDDTRGAVGLTLRAGEARADALDALGRAIRDATGELGL